jgi:hypothetical protein
MLFALVVFYALSSGISADGDSFEVDKLPSIPELPDPFLLPGGKRIASSSEWSKHRKALLDLVLRYEYGQLPPENDAVASEIVTDESLPGLAARVHTVMLSTGPGGSVRFKS